MGSMGATAAPKRKPRASKKAPKQPTPPIAPRGEGGPVGIYAYDTNGFIRINMPDVLDWDKGLEFIAKAREMSDDLEFRAVNRLTGELEVFRRPLPTPTLDDNPEQATTVAQETAPAPS